MTNMAIMPIYGKNIKKISSPEPIEWWLWNLVCSIGNLSNTKIVQTMTLDWSCPILWQGRIEENANTYDFMESLEDFRLKIAK